MNQSFFGRTLVGAVAAALILFFSARASAQYTNGIFAEFNTSLGSYTCVLYYAQSPKAVANFIGLATGQRSWLDLPHGVVKTNPFYAGTTFHRVIAGFMNQGGSPNGLGTDGPGYAFVDEFTNTLRFDGFGVLAMANSGPDSNGSQYFITVSPQTQLNDVHTVFGGLYGGSNVVYAINQVATDAQNKPLTNVVVNQIKIQRVGAAAAAFDIAAQGLPWVTNLNLNITQAGTNVSLTFSNRLNAENRLYVSSDLASWTANSLGFETAAPVSNVILQNTAGAAKFFRAAQVQYPPTLFVPKNVLGRTMTLNFSAGNGTFVVSFDAAGGGTYTWTAGSPGTVAYNWSQDAYRGRFSLIVFSAQNLGMVLHLGYDTATTGAFKGTAYPYYPYSIGAVAVSGTFASSP